MTEFQPTVTIDWTPYFDLIKCKLQESKIHLKLKLDEIESNMNIYLKECHHERQGIAK